MFVTFRRRYLDQLLQQESFTGDVLDIGGERNGSRSAFRPPLGNVRSWKIANLDPKVDPDYCCSAESIPVPDQSVNTALLCEILEHVKSPDQVLREATRLLKPGGTLLASIPFLNAVHGDPHDFQRWTPQKITEAFEAAGLEQVRVRPMGGLVAVVLDLFEAYCSMEYESKGKLPFRLRAMRVVLRRILDGWLLGLDRRLPYTDFISTGFFIQATKPLSVA